MNKILTASILAFATLAAKADMPANEVGVLALKDVVDEATASLNASAAVPAGKAIAILPLEGGDEMAAGILKNMLTAAGKTCVEGKDDPVLGAILDEIAWDERRDDILDQSTIDRFGRLKSAQYLLYGGVRRVASSPRYVLVEMELHVSSIETKRHVWGGTFARRHYAPGADPVGMSEIPTAVRTALVDGIRDRILASIMSKTSLAGKKIAILPIAGDIDQYVGGLVRDVVSRSAATPVNLDATTRAEARFAMREGGGKGDAIAYGALRDIDVKLVETTVDGVKKHSATMEVQLWVEEAATRAILWSDTIVFSTEFEVGARGWWDKLCHLCPWFRTHPAALVWIPLALVVGLILFVRWTRPR